MVGLLTRILLGLLTKGRKNIWKNKRSYKICSTDFFFQSLKSDFRPFIPSLLSFDLLSFELLSFLPFAIDSLASKSYVKTRTPVSICTCDQWKMALFPGAAVPRKWIPFLTTIRALLLMVDDDARRYASTDVHSHKLAGPAREFCTCPQREATRTGNPSAAAARAFTMFN